MSKVRMFYTVRRSQHRDGAGYGYYYPAFKRGINDTWHLYQNKGATIAFTTFEGAYEYLRKKHNYNDARLSLMYVW